MEKNKNRFVFLIAVMLLYLFPSCKEVLTNPNDKDCDLPGIQSTSTVEGFGILEKLPGIWNGPVYSPTPLGSFSEWIVDFRPISSAQVSAKNELDSLNDIFMSFFLVQFDCAYKIAFRNGGGFAGLQRNSYMIIDSVSENSVQSFYRFVDPVSGGSRVYTEIRFVKDSMIMHTYTNKYNTLPKPEIHMIWRAQLKDTTSSQEAIAQFNFPQKVLVRDFSLTFDGLQEAVFYSAGDDPYPEESQPYLGNAKVVAAIDIPEAIDPLRKVLIIISTRPLINLAGFNLDLNSRSRYVFTGAASSASYNFNYMHPGNYYVNALYDKNGDLKFGSGDYINSPFNIPFSLSEKGSTEIMATINFEIP